MIDFGSILILAPSAAFCRVSDSLMYVLSDRDPVLVRGKEMVLVLALVDGQRTKQEVLLLAGAQLGDASAFLALDQLEAAGHVQELVAEHSASALAFWHAHGAHSPSAFSRLSNTTVTVRGRDSTLVKEVCQALRGAGLETIQHTEAMLREGGSEQLLTVWVVDDYLDPELAAINQAHLASGVPWALVSPTRAVPFLGPLFEPGKDGPCWECVAERLRRNQPLREHLRKSQKKGAETDTPPAHLPASRQVALGLLALSLARDLMAGVKRFALMDHIVSFDASVLAVARHSVSRRPQCVACGDTTLMQAQMEQPMRLAAVSKHRPHVGGYRHMEAGSTFEYYAKLVDPYVGAVTFLFQLPRSEGRSAPVFVSGYTAPVDDESGVSQCLRLCAGKGRSRSQAQASALCEALERRSGVCEGDEPRRRTTLRELGGRGLAPSVLEGFSDQQYANRDELNCSGSASALWIPQRLDPDTAIDWVPAWSLTHDERRYVPFDYCFSRAQSEDSTFCRPCGNGVAAGTCREEALLQGLLELIERDAVAIWWYNRIRRRAIEPRSLPGTIAALLADYRRDGTEAWLLDLTHDIGVAACAAIGRRRRGARFIYSFGFGCHLDPRLAAERALTELHQLGDGVHPGTGKPYVDTDSLRDAQFLMPVDRAGVACDELPSFDGEDLRVDIQACVSRLRERELEVVALDKTRPDIGLCVVQVIVPGLRHMRPRLGRGRLYDVPVRMSWLSTPRKEEELTSVPLVL